jgi:hypothetical protein
MKKKLNYSNIFLILSDSIGLIKLISDKSFALDELII